jgi:phosphoribosylamine--glycine ligase
VNVLVLGSGAREHALAWKLRQSPRVDDLFVAPGNPGTATVAQNLALDPLDFEEVSRAVRADRVELVVVGPEDPLAAGIIDYLSVQGILAFGPMRAAAQIEASKQFAKQLMAQAGIPTAASAAFDAFEPAAAYVRGAAAPPVIKADGLAAGKGVTVAHSTEEALAALRTVMLDQVFGEAGARVVIEERLHGREVSAHAFSDGFAIRPMPFACDHKAVFDGGRGPNTGGMGAFSPVPFLSADQEREIQAQIIEPAVRALAALGHPFRGVLYPGLMLTNAGARVIEFNGRFGDPETQVLLPRLRGDLLEPLWGCVMNSLDQVALDWSDEACVGVVLASGGYPGPYQRGLPIEGIEDIDEDILVFHAGTALDGRGRLVTAGGRVLTLVALGPTLEAARRRVYDNVERVRFDGCQYRTDIGLAESSAERQ